LGRPGLAAERPTLTICGTLFYVKGKDFFRQEWTKSDAGYRMIVLPRFAVGMLLARKLVASDNPNDAIFASRHDTWLSPNNVRRQWRQARAETSLEWVTPHTFRKTVARLIDKEADTKSAAAQLGHASQEVTDKYYIAKPVLAPDVSEILQQLGFDRGADDRAQGHRRPKWAALVSPDRRPVRRRQTMHVDDEPGCRPRLLGGFRGGSKLHRQRSKL
jgi:hypothetical protein